MSNVDPLVSPLINLKTSFREVFLEVCHQGYSVLGRTPASTPDNFNRWQYGSGHPPSYFAQGRYRFLKTLEVAQSLQPKSILEVAAGGGFNGACLYESGRRVVLNDMRLLEDEVQQFLTGKNLETFLGNLFELTPDSIGHFDLVMACEVLEHVAHGKELINHLKQFLSPVGSLLLTTPNGCYFRSKLPTYSQITDFTVFENEQFKPDADGHLYFYTSQEISDILKGAGFRDIFIDLSITPFLSGHIGFRLLPSSQCITPMYYSLDTLTRKLGIKARTKLCTQMIILAKVD
jgi:2-polyprenyl-6-hydroxyphenyl methylase/3-demethylubiquinone-9 3-methyltransferase